MRKHVPKFRAGEVVSAGKLSELARDVEQIAMRSSGGDVSSDVRFGSTSAASDRISLFEIGATFVVDPDATTPDSEANEEVAYKSTGCKLVHLFKPDGLYRPRTTGQAEVLWYTSKPGATPPFSPEDWAWAVFNRQSGRWEIITVPSSPSAKRYAMTGSSGIPAASRNGAGEITPGSASCATYTWTGTVYTPNGLETIYNPFPDQITGDRLISYTPDADGLLTIDAEACNAFPTLSSSSSGT